MSKPEKNTTEDELLTSRLRSIYEMMIIAALEGSVGDLFSLDPSLNDVFATTTLPDIVMHLAAKLKFIPPPTKKDEDGVFQFDTTSGVWIDGMKRLQPDIKAFGEGMNNAPLDAYKLRKPTPRKTIMQFCTEYKINRTTKLVMMVEPLVDVITKKPYVCLTTRTAIERLIAIPDVKKMLRKSKLRLNSTAQRDLAEKLFAVIKKHDSKNIFPNLVLEDLLWALI